jgi:hypothetical protein
LKGSYENYERLKLGDLFEKKIYIKQLGFKEDYINSDHTFYQQKNAHHIFDVN